MSSLGLLELGERTAGLRATRTPFVLATVVRAERPTSAKAGDRALVFPDGSMDGFVGGECAESTVREAALDLLGTGGSTLLRIQPTELPEPTEPTESPDGPEPNGGAGTGGRPEGLTVIDHSCMSGGTLEIFLESVLPPVLLYVFGDSPVARALERIGIATGYEIQRTADPAVPVGEGTAAVIVASHGRDEGPVLDAALRAGVPYVALVASRRRGSAVSASLGPQGSTVHSPAGLDLGARTPAEVALSILAELVTVRAAATAR